MRECKGLILDESMDWRVVCYPPQKIRTMKKQEDEASVKWSVEDDIIVEEKVDGTEVSLYYHDKKWHIATQCMYFIFFQQLI